MYKTVHKIFTNTSVLIITALFFIIVFTYCIYVNKNKNKNKNINGRDNIDSFEDTPTQTTTSTIDISTAPTPENKNKTCTNSTDMINVCMNYENCCTGSGANPNSKCFCNHPFVGGCNDSYKACLAGIGAGVILVSVIMN